MSFTFCKISSYNIYILNVLVLHSTEMLAYLVWGHLPALPAYTSNKSVLSVFWMSLISTESETLYNSIKDSFKRCEKLSAVACE